MGEYGALTILVITILGLLLATIWIAMPIVWTRNRAVLVDIHNELRQIIRQLEGIKEKQDETIQKMSLMGRMVDELESRQKPF